MKLESLWAATQDVGQTSLFDLGEDVVIYHIISLCSWVFSSLSSMPGLETRFISHRITHIALGFLGGDLGFLWRYFSLH